MVTGVVLSDQVKSLDWKIRDDEFCDKLPEAVVLEIFKKLETLLNFAMLHPTLALANLF